MQSNPNKTVHPVLEWGSKARKIEANRLRSTDRRAALNDQQDQS